MHINSFFMRSSAQADIGRMFGSRFGNSSPSETHGKSHHAHSHRAQAPGQTAPMRDAVKAILDVLGTVNPDGVSVVTATRGNTTYDGVKGSQNDDILTYSDAVPDRVINAYIDAGAGDDVISLSSLSGGEHEVRGGSGNDSISASAQRLRAVSGGSGNDAIAAAGEYIGSVSGGSGEDVIGAAARFISRVDGGSGNDTISVTGDYVGRVSGGSGDDTIVVNSGNQRLVGTGIYSIGPYGLGRPTIVDGGSGNDNITLGGEALVAFKAGDGQDTVTISDRTEFAIFGESWGDDVMTLDDANFTFENGALTVSFDGRDEKITILSGGGDLKLEMTSDRTFVVTPG